MNTLNAQNDFAVYYADTLDHNAFTTYKTLVFDSDEHPAVWPLVSKNITVLGYLSAGEIENSRWYYEKFKDSAILLGENKNWTGSYYADIRKSEWISFILKELIPRIIRQGFNGVFLDTLDSPIYLEETNPEKYKGMKEGAIHLIRAIRLNYPQLKIMVNRAYEILPESGKYIDMELAESLYSDYDFDTKKYILVPQSDYDEQLAILKKAQKTYPKLEIFTLDYWDKDDKEGIKKIYAVERANGFIPFVSTINLDQIIDE